MQAVRRCLAFVFSLLVIFTLGCSENEETPEQPEKDTTPPTVTATFPEQGAPNVTRNGPYWFVFSESMNEESVEDAVTTSPSFGYFDSWNGDTLFITPTQLLEAGAPYTITIGTGAKDLAGNSLESAFQLAFTTTSEEDQTPPTIVSTVPEDGAENVAGAADIEITFSEPMSVWETQNAIILSPEPEEVDFEWNGTTLLIQHNSFGSNVQVTVTVTTSARDLAGNSLASDYSFSFTTAEDNTRPYLASASPANNATNVSRYTSSIIMTFSEPMDQFSFDNIGLEDLDARMMQLIQEEPEFEDATLTINVAHQLLPGCHYWVNLRDVTDQAGNLIDPNPTLYSFTTSGTMTYYPFLDPNKWYYRDEDDNYFTKEVRNYNSSSGYFEVADRDESNVINHVEKLRYSSIDNMIYHLGVADYGEDGDFVFSMDWSDPLPYLRVPVESHLGESWNLSTDGTVSTGEGDSYTLTLTGSVQIDPYKVDIVSEELEGTFKDCIAMHLYVHIIIYDGQTQKEEMNMHNIMYLAPCVGPVKLIENNLIESESDTTYIYNWETN